MNLRVLAISIAAIAGAAQGQLPSYRISTVAGSSSIGDGGPATAAQLGTVQGIATDRLGNTYLSDTDRNLVRKIDAKGVITTIAGNGTAGFSGDGGPATSASLNLPYGLAVDLNGNIYVADLGNQRVRRVSPDGTITTLAGTGVKGSLGDGGLAADAQLMSPRNVAVDLAGDLFISEFEGHRVREVAPNGKISTVAGTGVAGFRGDGGLAVNSQIAYPAGLTVDRNGALYLADSSNQRIRRIIPGGIVTTVVGGMTGMVLLTPVAVAVDLYGNIYTADSSLVLHEATAAGGWIAVAGNGAPGFTGDGGPAAKAQFSNLRDLAFDINGNLLLADGIRVREIAPGGTIATIAGDGFLRAVGDGAPATQAILNLPMDIALDRLGNLYIADTGTQRVRIVPANGLMNTLAGTGDAGYNGDQIPAATATLYSPMGVAADMYGGVYIADSYNHRIREVGASGKIATVAGTGKSGEGPIDMLPLQTELRGPRGVCLGRNGTIYIVDTANHRVLAVPTGGYAATVAGNGTAGLGGDGGPANLAELNQPGACAVDSAGDLFIADTLNHRIAKVDPSGVINTVAGTGSAGLSPDGVTGPAAALNSPAGIAADDNGNIYISDTGNNLIRLLTQDGILHTIAGTAATGFSGDGGLALSARLNAPSGLFLDGSGNLYFADTGNNRVRVLSPQAATPPAITPVTATPLLSAVSAASLLAGPIAPGEIVTIYGTSIGPVQGIAGTLNASGLLMNLLGGSEAYFDGVPAPLFYAQAGQVNAQAPYTIAGQTFTHVEVRYQGQTAGAADLQVAPASPALFPTVLNPDGSLNGVTNPAPAGGVLTFFATGEGLTSGANVTGQPAPFPYAQPVLPAMMSIGGETANLLYAGEAPGLIGMLQVNAVIPPDAVSGGNNCVLTIGTYASTPLSVWVR